MPSTYSNIKIQLMATGENNTTWGDVTNVNLGTALEEAIVGSADVAFSNANVTLTLTDTNATQTARNMRLNLTGTATSGYNLVVPNIEKPYIVNNGTDGTITIKNATGTGIAVPAGKTMWVYNNGTNVVDVVTQVTSLQTSGNVTIGGGGDLLLSSASGGNNTVLFNDAQDLSVNVNSATRLYISSTGLTGVGATAPKTRLQVTAGGFLNAPVLGSATGAPFYMTNADASYGLLAGVNSVDGHSWLQGQRTDGTANSANITINEAGGNVGIGTSSPGARVDIVGPALTASTPSTYALWIANSGGANGDLAMGSNASAAFIQSFGSKSLLLNSQGNNVGIGTSTPSSNGRLSVNGNIVLGPLTRNQAATQSVGVWSTGDPADDARANIGFTTVAGAASSSSFITFATNNYGVSGGERMRIDSSGNVGIGVTLPGATGISPFLAIGANNAGIGSASANNIAVVTNNTERMRVTAAGDVGIGTSAPGQTLQIVSASNYQFRLGAGSTFNYDIGRNTSDGFLYFYGNQSTFTGYVFSGVDGERMRINASGNVGIGTSSPGGGANDRIVAASGSSSAAFQANGGSVSTQFGSTSAGWGLVNVTSNHPLLISTNNTERMRVDTSGNVGIGTSSPSVRMEVVGASGFNPATQSTYAMWVANSGAANGDLAFGSSTTAAHIQSWGGKPLALNSQGNNVGIGTNSPGVNLDVAATTSSQVRVRETGSSVDNRLVSLTTAGIVGTYSNHPLAFYTNAAERMRINSNGDLLVGTTANLGGNTASEFKKTDADAWPLTLNANNRGLLVRNSAASTGFYAYFEYDNGTNNGSISWSGGTTFYNTTSDARIKDNIVDAPDAGDLIDTIKVRSWDFKADGMHWRYGMVAQELLDVVPEAVSVPADEEMMMGVDYAKLVPMLIKEMQALRARVAQLEGK